MRREVIYRADGPAPSGDRPGSVFAARVAAGVVLWQCWHFGMWGFVAAAGTYLVVLVVLKSWIGGPWR